MKKLLSTVLALALALSISAPCLAAETPTYDDVYGTDWFADDVRYVYQLNLMDGRGGSFQPDANSSRGEIVLAMYRLEGGPASSNANQFTDVPSGSTYERAVVWANEHGIVGGYGNGKFGPDDQVTREQFAAIMRRYAGYKGKDTAARAQLGIFTDAEQISDWAVGDMSWAVAVGVISGTSDTTLSPQGTTTRSQTAAIIHRYGENTLNVTPTAGAPTFAVATETAASQHLIEIPYTNEELVDMYGGDVDGWAELRRINSEGIAQMFAAAEASGFSASEELHYLDPYIYSYNSDPLYDCGIAGTFQKGSISIRYVMDSYAIIGLRSGNIPTWDIYSDGIHIVRHFLIDDNAFLEFIATFSAY